MHNLLHRIRRWWALRTAMAQAESKGDPDALVALLQRYPESAETLAASALVSHRSGAEWVSLLYCTALVLTGDRAALEVLRTLLTYNPRERQSSHYQPVPWEKLSVSQAQAYAVYLAKQGTLADAELLFQTLPDEQLLALRPPFKERVFFPWVAVALSRGLSAALDAQPLIASAQQAAILPASPQAVEARRFLDRCFRNVCSTIQRSGRTTAKQVALRVISALWPVGGQPVDEPTLASIVELLLQLVPAPTEGAARLSEDDAADLWRAADLLRHHRSVRWVEPLRRIWLRLDGRVRQQFLGFGEDGGNIDKGVSSRLELAGGAVLAALGACAACDRSFTSFEQDERISQGLAARIDECNRLVEYYNGLVKQYMQRGQPADGPRDLAPGREGRSNGPETGGPFVSGNRPITIAPPLRRVFPSHSVMDPEVRRSLSAEIHDTKDRISHLSREIDQLRENREHHSAGFLAWSVLRETTAYPVSIRQGAAWALHLLYREGRLEDEARDRIRNAIHGAVTGHDNRDFRERRIQLLPGQGVAEVATSLRDGLLWAAELTEGNYATASVEEEARPQVPSAADLELTVTLLCELMSEALTFLTTYPLRLMPLDDHRTALGIYFTEGYELPLWTEFSGTRFSGEVTRRGLQLVDRSVPNAIGIYHRLFRHPALALAVLYHEHLHYGGPDGNPTRGIANEAEVLLREIVFARALIARLAKDMADERLPEFEQSLVNHVESLGLNGLLLQWMCNFEDDEELERTNRGLRDTYGDWQSEDEAERHVQLSFASHNLHIQLKNDTEAAYWCPDVMWSYLDAPDTERLSRELRNIILRHSRSRHALTPGERDKILAEPGQQLAQATWKAYCNRPGACTRLRDGYDRLSAKLLPEELLQLLVQRFAVFRLPEETR